MGNVTVPKVLSWCGKGLLTALLVAGSFQLSGKAAALPVDHIRVGMFMDLGSTYKSTTTAVTISSGQAWTVGFNTPAGHSNLITLGSGEQARFSVDGFRIKVLETADLSTATEAYKKLAATADKPIIFTATSTGGQVYQLYTGYYATEQTAASAVARAAKTASAYLNGQTPAVKGPKHLSAGTYASEAQAASAVSTIKAAGFDAMVALEQTSDGGSRYAAWVGEAGNDNELEALRSSVSAKLPQLALSNVDSSLPAFIIRQDVSLGQAVNHYQLSGNDAKGWIENGGSEIKVAERSGRSYRGAMEISSLNGQLALVNDLPFEQYLYSVVGGEVPSSWPADALKAQAVAARSYAEFQAGQSSKFKIADVVDTTLSQAYNGISSESASVIQAVDATQGEVILKDGKVVEAVFSSNAGGVSADPSEVWNSGGDAFASVPSEGDEAAVKGQKMWYHVLLSSGASGFIREDNAKETGILTGGGLAKLTVTAKDTNVRPLPQIQSDASPVAKMNPGDTAVVLEKVQESGTYSWVRGPYSSAELVKSLQGKTATAAPSSITTLEVTKRGPSGRATEIKANGQILDVKYPDLFRSALNGLPSTLFDIVPTGSYTVLSANGTTSKITGSSSMTVLSASGQSTVQGSGTVVMNGNQSARSIDSGEGFMFVGRGNGHGLGLSQWGAKGMADAGYGYQDILKHYYQNVTITKE
ncbi:SpoIID/LytB domain-containing protein [Paenibacillus dokdonensis]|uniref:SpoIID/LytB domain-containing protein n=1 Tax=Paenibacillus dokdonensis TaxID=2567944 RepID=A0ABU6GNN5_9BACL|nr:SpoIID/LytB domain-containing protein [Paenibacillus dokdonensis]MEC0241351.1 SpoIID/LytB domain-containing protein [Paenibacillus dokdonensis]